MLATNIVKICRWLFPLCIRVIWPESIVLSTKQIPDCWTLCGQDWGLMVCFACEWWQFIRRMQDIIGQAAAVGGAGSLSIEATQLATAGPPPPPGLYVRQSDLDCVSCVMSPRSLSTHITQKERMNDTPNFSFFRALPLKAWNVNEAKILSPSKVLRELLILTTVVFDFYEDLSNSESVLWNLMKYD